jgi:hypothetical protein
MAKGLCKTEWIEWNCPGPATQGRGNLLGEKGRRGTSNKNLSLAAIEQPPDKTLPARHHLDFVKTSGDRPTTTCHPATIFLKQKTKMLTLKAGQAFILKVDIRQLCQRSSPYHAFLTQLMQKTGLAGPAHANDRLGLAWQRDRAIHPSFCHLRY